TVVPEGAGSKPRPFRGTAPRLARGSGRGLRDGLEFARGDPLLDRLHLLHQGRRDPGRDLPVPDAAVGDREDGVEVRAEQRLGLPRRVDGLVDRDVDLLRGTRHHVRPEVALVGVDADADDTALLGRREDTETALAGDLEDDACTVGDLVQRLLLALRLVDEVLRVGVRDRHLRAGTLRTRVVARDEAVHRRDLEAAD